MLYNILASCTTTPLPNTINNNATETTTPKIAYNNTVGTRPTGNGDAMKIL